MNSFLDVVGQEQMIAHFSHAIREKKVSHSYLIDGGSHSGKRMMADIFAATLSCENPTYTEDGIPLPCGSCLSCIQAAGDNQPDIIHVSHEKPASIGVNDIRAMRNDIQIKPYRSPYKIYIVPDAEKMTVQAQNALLKTLEEPPAYIVLLLLAEGTERFLPTVLSRMITLKMKPVSEGKIQQYLTEQCEIPANLAHQAAAFASGNVGRARMIATSEEFTTLLSSVQDLVQTLPSKDASEIKIAISAITSVKRTETSLADALDLMQMWYRDVLLIKSVPEADNLLFTNGVQYIKDASVRLSYENIEHIQEAFTKARKQLKANVNQDQAILSLLLTIQDNSRG